MTDYRRGLEYRYQRLLEKLNEAVKKQLYALEAGDDEMLRIAEREEEKVQDSLDRLDRRIMNRPKH